MEVPIGVLIDANIKCLKVLRHDAKILLDKYNTINNGNIFTRLFNLHKPLKTIYDKKAYSSPRRGKKILDQITIIRRRIFIGLIDDIDLSSTRKNLGDEVIIEVTTDYEYLLPYIEHEFEVVY